MRYDALFGRDGKLVYKEVAEYMSMKLNTEDNVKMYTSPMREALTQMGPQMDDVFHRYTLSTSLEYSPHNFVFLPSCKSVCCIVQFDMMFT